MASKPKTALANAADWLDAFAFLHNAGLDEGLLEAPAPLRERQREAARLLPRTPLAPGKPAARTTKPASRFSTEIPGAAAPATKRGEPVRLPARSPKKPAAHLMATEAANAASHFQALEKAVCAFDGCPLKESARRTVFSRGSPDARLLLLGEAPGAEEDRTGQPFVGRAGRLLDQVLRAIDLTENDVLISNAVYWRPPGNRNPTPLERQVCRPFVERLITLQQPAFVVLLGAQAAKSLLGEDRLKALGGLSRIRGTVHTFQLDATAPDAPTQMPVVATFHPAYLLRQPGQKRQAWADWLEIRRLFDQAKRGERILPLS